MTAGKPMQDFKPWPVSSSAFWTLLFSLGLFGLVGCGPSDDDSSGSGGAADETTPSYAMAESDAAEAGEENPQVVRGDVFEDWHYAMTLRRPSGDWRFLDEAQAREMSPDAMMGTINPATQSFAILIVERLADMALDDYEKLVFMDSPLGAAVELDRRSVTIDGCPGLLLKRRAIIEGIDFTYRIQIVQRDDFFYNLSCWTMSGKFAEVDPQLSALCSSLKFVKDRQPQVRAVLGGGDAFGFDWRIADNVFSNASFGFRLRPTEGFRLPGQGELKNMNVDASAGVVCNTPTFYQIYVVEPLGNADRGEFLNMALAQVGEELPIAGAEPELTDVVVGGIPAQQRIFRRVNFSGVAFDFTLTTFFRNSTIFRIQSWWPSSEADEAAVKLAESYGHLEWLSDRERRELEDELVKLDADNAIGTDYSYRNGVFRDFEYGYALKTPPGLWQVHTGDTVMAQNPAARLILSRPAQGVTVFVIPEEGNFTNAEFHAVLRRNLGVSDDTLVRSKQTVDAELLVSSFRAVESGVDLSIRLATAVRGKRLVQILVTALQCNEQHLDDRLDDVIDGFDFHNTRLPETQRKGSRIVDHRVGFQFQAPRDCTIQISTPPHIQAAGSIVVATNDRVICTAMGVWIPGGFNADMALDGMIKTGMIEVTPGSRRESESTMAGLPARRIVMTGKMESDQIFLKVWVIRRSQTMYMLAVVGKLGSQEQAESETYKDLFQLVK